MKIRRRRKIEEREASVRSRIRTLEGKGRLPSPKQLDNGHFGWPKRKNAARAMGFMKEQGMPPVSNGELAINHVSRTVSHLRGYYMRGGRRRSHKAHGVRPPGSKER